MSQRSLRSASYSIPSKYQTEVVVNSLNKKGFQSKSARFLEKSDETPGPGAYSGPAVFNSSSPSYGARGTGNFASRARRMPTERRKKAPSPSSYNLTREIVQRQDFSNKNSSSFQKPIAVEKKMRKSRTRQPAPNQYNTTKTPHASSSLHSCHSSFKSKTARYLDKPVQAGSNVSPAKYDPAPLSKGYSVTCFKSKSNRLQKMERGDNPGPGAYNLDGDDKLIVENVYPTYRKHGLLISAVAMPMPSPPPLPGPGAYDIVDFKGPDKTSMSSAVFKSGSSRLLKPEVNGIPGPGQYEPKFPTRKVSYYYDRNSDRKKWLGV